MIYFQIIYLTSAHLVHLTTKVTSVLRLHNKFRYRTHLIDSFNRDPIQCKCGAIMQYTYTYNPFKDKRYDALT